MKRLTVAVILLAFVLSSLFCFPVSAATGDPLDDLNFRFPSSYTKLTRDNLSKNSKLVKQLGFTPSSLKNYMKQENIYIIAAGEEAKGEFHIKCTETDFSKQMKSFAGLGSESLTKINNTLFGGNAEACNIGKSDTIYFRTKSRAETAEFYTYQYATVENGKLYSFVYYGDSSDEIDDFMKSLEIKTQKKSNPATVATGILIAVIIIACLVAMGIIVVTIVMDLKNPVEDDLEETEYIRIKRRKM
ncbi:MAG: hypothetical protein IKV36_03820 [Clostridia bacterium]|nr:hypothetical protein [Clostridia bacterium]